MNNSILIQDNLVKDAQGQEMLCIGGWNETGSCTHLTSALTAVHENAHGRIGGYHERCDTCLAEFVAGNPTGCVYHVGDPQTKRSGNVVHSTLVKDTVSFCHKTSDHVVQGARQLLPSQVRQIRDYCINSNDKCLVAIYTMLLLSIYLFLRKMEVEGLTDENFNIEMFVMTKEFLVDALNLKIHGKSKRTRDRGKCWPAA